MKKLNFNLSATALSLFVSCPWAFEQSKILNKIVVSKPAATLVLAQAFHDLMKTFYNNKNFNVKILFDSWEDAFNKKTKEYKCTDPYLNYAKNSGYTMIKNWIIMAKANKWLREARYFGNDYAVELEFLLPFENDRYIINVHGFIDIILEIDDKFYIIDWKTGKYYDYYIYQALIYSWAFNKKYQFVEERVLFVHPAKKVNDIFFIKVNDEDYNKILKLANKLFDCVDENKFKKNKGDHCRYCDFIDCENNTNDTLKVYIKQVELIAK